MSVQIQLPVGTVERPVYETDQKYNARLDDEIRILGPVNAKLKGLK